MNQTRFYQTRAQKIRIAAIGFFAGMLVVASPVVRAGGPALPPPPPAPAVAAAPTSVAVIDLRKAYVKLQETTETENLLKSMAQELEVKKTSHKDQLNDMQNTIMKTVKPDSKQHDDMMNDFDKKSMDFQADEQQLQIRMVRLQGRQMARAFSVIQAKVADIAKAKGYDLVLVNQSPELPDNLADIPNLETMRNAILNRNTIYVSQKIDITDDVIAQVDAALKAAAVAPAPAAK